MVADAVLAHHGVERAVVTIHKPEAPVEAVVGDISVTVDRSR
jgi:dihydroneopterin aldolase